MPEKQTYSSKIFISFKAINHRDAKAIVRFYHQNKTRIHELRFYESFVLQLRYTSALHDLGAYEKHLLEADNIIYLSIDNNIQYYQGEDIYQKTLIEKAQSYYFLGDFKQAKHIYLELIKIAPNNKKYAKALMQVLLKTDANYIENILLSGVFTLLFSIGFATLYLLLFDYVVVYQQLFSNIIASSFILGLLSLISGLFLEKTILEKKVETIRRNVLKRKNRTKA